MRKKFKCGTHAMDINVDSCPLCINAQLEKEMAAMTERLEELEIWKKAYDDISGSYSGKANDLGIALRRATDELQNMEATIQKICETKGKAGKKKA